MVMSESRRPTDPIRSQSSHILSLGTQRPTPAARAEVMAATHSKWEGVQAVAINVLGRSGDQESTVALRAFLSESFDREHGWAIRGVAVRLLVSLLTPEDAAWVLDLYFDLPDRLSKREILRLVIALHPETARARLLAALRDANDVNRWAAVVAIGNMPYVDRRALIWPYREDPNVSVRRSARALSDRRDRA